MAGLHVVVGAGPPLGAAVVHRLHISGQQTRAVVLDPDRMSSTFDPAVELVVGDLTNPQSVENACKGASVVYNCFEPLLSRWQELTAKVSSNLLLASINERALLVIASRLFNSEYDNQAMENDALEAFSSRVARVVIAQIPQVYGPGTVPDAFADVFDDAISGKRSHWAGPMDVRRSMVYLLDAADALVSLANTELTQGRRWPIAGAGPVTGREIIEMAFRAAEKRARISTGLRALAERVPIPKPRSPFDYETEFGLDETDFSLAFPGFGFTPHETAVATTFEWYRDRLQIRQGRTAPREGPE